MYVPQEIFYGTHTVHFLLSIDVSPNMTDFLSNFCVCFGECGAVTSFLPVVYNMVLYHAYLLYQPIPDQPILTFQK